MIRWLSFLTLKTDAVVEIINFKNIQLVELYNNASGLNLLSCFPVEFKSLVFLIFYLFHCFILFNISYVHK